MKLAAYRPNRAALLDAQGVSHPLRKVAGEIKAIIIKKRMVPQEDEVCPHCGQVIGEKESFWPEEYRDDPDRMVMQHGPCGGLYFKEIKPIDLGSILAGPFKALTEKDDADPRLERLRIRRDPDGIEKTSEVKLDINVGDVLLGGRFRNMPIVVREIGKDELGQPTINGRKLLSYRIQKHLPKDHRGRKIKPKNKTAASQDKDQFDPAPLFRNAWKEEIQDARDECDFTFDLENDEPLDKPLRTLSFPRGGDRSPTRFKAQICHAGGDWENQTLYFRVQLVAGWLPDHSYHARSAFFCMIPPPEHGNDNVKDGATTHNDEADNKVNEGSYRKAWKWLEAELGKQVKRQTKKAADKPLRRRVEVIITDGLNVWGEKKRPEQGGIWFPGGGVDSRDEKFADAAAREVIEESGFQLNEIYRLSRIKPVACEWEDSVYQEGDEKWREKMKRWRGDITYLYVATVDHQVAPTSQEGDVMPGEWMRYPAAIRKLRNAVDHENKGWQKLTKARLKAVEMLAPSGLKVPARGEVEDIVDLEETDG